MSNQIQPSHSNSSDMAQEAQPVSELEREMDKIEFARGLMEYRARQINNPELAAQISIAISLNRIASWLTKSDGRTETSSPGSLPKKNEW